MSKNKKILIVNCGWTIVMKLDESRKTIVTVENIDEILSIFPDLSSIADVEIQTLINKDSTNIIPDDWSKIAMFIFENHEKYDWFVITHWTNTMAYTASALSLALWKWLKKPVVLTWSQLPLCMYWTDARFNFENAVKTAMVAVDKWINEVMIAFSDKILRWSRSVKISESSFSAFNSPAYPQIWTITSTWIEFSTIARKFDSKTKFQLNHHFSTNIVSIDLTPWQSPDLLMEMILSWKCKWVILKSHWAWSVPTEWQFNFLPFIEKVTADYKVPVIVSTKFLWWNAYKDVNDECAILAIKAWAIPWYDLTDVMTEVKLMWILSQWSYSEDQVRDKILTNYTWELNEIRYRYH